MSMSSRGGSKYPPRGFTHRLDPSKANTNMDAYEMMKLSVRGSPKDAKKFNLTHAGGGGMLAGPPLSVRSNPVLQHSARLTARRVNRLETIIERGK